MATESTVIASGGLIYVGVFFGVILINICNSLWQNYHRPSERSRRRQIQWETRQSVRRIEAIGRQTREQIRSEVRYRRLDR